MIGDHARWRGRIVRITDEYWGVVMFTLKGKHYEAMISELEPIHLRILR